MFQTVGHNLISAIAECMEIPLFKGELHAIATQKSLEYDETIKQSSNVYDEVEELYALLSRVKESMPNIQGVSCGAIFSDYQRNRVENVCARLGLVSFCYLWRKDQSELLSEMIENGIHAILIKTAAMGLSPKKHCGKTLAQLRPVFEKLKSTIDLNVCGEGGEYESITLDCPLFKKRIIIDKSDIISLDENPYAPVGYLYIQEWHLECKTKIDTILTSTNNSVIINTFIRTFDQKLSNKQYNIIQTLKSHIWCDLHITISSVQSYNRFLYSFVGYTNDLVNYEPFNDPYLQMRALFEVLNEKLKEKLKIDDPFKHLLHNVMIVRNMRDFSEVNRAYSSFFNMLPPSRVCIECDNINGLVKIECLLGMPSNHSLRLEIEDSTMFQKKVLHVQSISEWAPACIGPYSQATVIDNVIRSAGQIALLPQTMTIVEINRSFEQNLSLQMIQCLNNVHETLTALSSCIHNVVKCIIYVDVSRIGSEKDQIILEKLALTTYEQFIEEKQNSHYVKQYSRSDILPFSDLFRILYVTKLPRASTVEYHTVAVNNRLESVVIGDTLSTQLNPGTLQVQAITCFNNKQNHSYTHYVSISLLSAWDEKEADAISSLVMSTVKKITQQVNHVSNKFIICRIFSTEKTNSLTNFVALRAHQEGITVSEIPCKRVSLFKQHECLWCCEFEAVH
jgi:diphthine-ammonia ligase